MKIVLHTEQNPLNLAQVLVCFHLFFTCLMFCVNQNFKNVKIKAHKCKAAESANVLIIRSELTHNDWPVFYLTSWHNFKNVFYFTKLVFLYLTKEAF